MTDFSVAQAQAFSPTTTGVIVILDREGGRDTRTCHGRDAG
jgi:hypothetical protein